MKPGIKTIEGIICQSCQSKLIGLSGGRTAAAPGWCPHTGYGYLVNISADGELDLLQAERMTEAESDAMRERVTLAVNGARNRYRRRVRQWKLGPLIIEKY